MSNNSEEPNQETPPEEEGESRPKPKSGFFGRVPDFVFAIPIVFLILVVFVFGACLLAW